MEVYLEGTAGPGGWPVPGCGCASCGRLAPAQRRPLSVVIDRRVRLSPYQPSAPPAPAAPPRVAASGLPDSVDTAAPPSTTPPASGDLAASPLPDGYTIRHSGDGDEIIAPDGTRLLLAFPPHPAGPYEEMREHPDPHEGPFDLVLIDLLDRPERLGRLRLRGLVASTTQVIAVGADHRVSSETELGRRLAFWGARAVPDGTVVRIAPGWAPDEVPERPKRTLVLGGSRSGKSEEAEMRVAADPHVTYVATGPSGGDDPSWLARVKAHRDRRPAHWRTVETTDLPRLLDDPPGTLLIDGLGTWLAAVFDECGAWPGQTGTAPAITPEASPAESVARRCDELVEAWRRTPGPVVAVSDEVGLGVIPATASGRLFRDALGRLNQRLAQESEDVALVVAGRPVQLPL
ncbi:adenosylcobinamide kinase/adenosylcobinamide phosphate guanyltransferase [Planotetraspora thailandica]|uniref:Adenosylcobinamide kinase n=1 Tax=Planotetraspora thailandica TaxID=487172 RepID=A0A8J3V4J3_9ACTN|nr:bifunctional adenosylcobinamide kinase/adenosylcobinamide-phosphate guanylyltransferase [Planotetraspora thailandica]GII55422.1 adenosylcobinamide kinase/adenosylcobinamide phosphate guanyltransferase [Planotetraspora thailandica]